MIKIIMNKLRTWLFKDELKQFEEALHEHIHLENNIIFPRALELEKKEAI